MSKPVTQTMSRVACATIESVSKHALADLVIDLLRRQHGEALDGEALALAFTEAFSPIAAARGDRAVAVWRPKEGK